MKVTIECQCGNKDTLTIQKHGFQDIPKADKFNCDVCVFESAGSAFKIQCKKCEANILLR